MINIGYTITDFLSDCPPGASPLVEADYLRNVPSEQWAKALDVKKQGPLPGGGVRGGGSNLTT